MINISFPVKSRILKIFLLYPELDQKYQNSKTRLMSLMVIINERDLHVWHLEDMHNSGNPYFHMTNMTPQNHALVKESLNVQNRPLDINIAGDKKFIGVASDSHCNYGLRNYDLSSSATVSKEDTQNSHLKKLLNDQSSLFQIYVWGQIFFIGFKQNNKATDFT